MRYIAFFGLLFALLVPVSAVAGWEENYDALLKKYVTSEGVRYKAWKKNADDMKALTEVVTAIGDAKRTDLAFYLNAYNAWILHKTLAMYPTKSVKDPLFTFFLKDSIRVGGKKVSFNKLEKDLIRKKFSEPRIHFALNCASRSCPPLWNAVFKDGALEKPLAKLASDFMNSTNGVEVAGNKVRLSKIFEWYAEDFGGEKAVLEYIGENRKTPLPKGGSISYQTYNWNLNEAP